MAHNIHTRQSCFRLFVISNYRKYNGSVPGSVGKYDVEISNGIQFPVYFLIAIYTQNIIRGPLIDYINSSVQHLDYQPISKTFIIV